MPNGNGRKAREVKLGRALARTTKPVRYVRGAGRRLVIVREKTGLSSIRPAIYYAGESRAVVIAVEVGSVWYFYDAVSGDCVGWAEDERITVEANTIIIADEEGTDGK